jgi:Predicted membrane protein
MPERTLIGAVVAAAIVVVARRSQSLSASGAIAALALGALCSAAGLSWAAMLVGFFISATFVSRFKRTQKESRIADVVEKGGERDAFQVLANGGIFSAAALAYIVHPTSIWMCVGAGAIATASADTWSTEIGILSRRAPRSIIDGRTVAPGESGGVTWLGLAGGLAGAIVIACLTILTGFTRLATLTALIGGFTGCLMDSLLGGTLQSRRWCDRCNRGTERAVHVCGTITRVSGGLPWITNDTVNALSSAIGALAGLLIYVGNQ